jgi:hypothetical protein
VKKRGTSARDQQTQRKARSTQRKLTKQYTEETMKKASRAAGGFLKDSEKNKKKVRAITERARQAEASTGPRKRPTAKKKTSRGTR